MPRKNSTKAVSSELVWLLEPPAITPQKVPKNPPVLLLHMTPQSMLQFADVQPALATLGVRSIAHTVARLIDPFEGDSLRVVGVAQGLSLDLMRDFLLATGARALLLPGAHGEPYADPLNRPRIEHLFEGEAQVLFEAETAVMKKIATLPDGINAAATAAWIRRALAGETPVPLPIVNQLATCLFTAGYTTDMNQAKAIVAVETGSLAAA